MAVWLVARWFLGGEMVGGELPWWRDDRIPKDKVEHLSSYAHIVHRTAKQVIFHVVERTRTSLKCQKMKNTRAKRAKILSLSNMQICGVFVVVVVVVA